MRRLLYIVMTAGVLLAGASSACSRDEEVSPGSDSKSDIDMDSEFVPSGTWKMTYDSYKCMTAGGDYNNRTNNVIITTAGNSVAIKGLFLEYPDGNVTGTIEGHKLILEPNQKMCDDKKGDPVYFICGGACWSFSSGHTFHQEDVTFGNISPVSFIISDDGKSMTVEDVRNGRNGRKAFWYGDKPDKKIYFDSGYSYGYDGDGNFIDTPYGTGFPDVDFKINIKLEKIDTE